MDCVLAELRRISRVSLEMGKNVYICFVKTSGDTQVES